MNTSQEFREGVVYSRGPLIKGILRGLIFPGLIVIAGALGFVWYKIQTQETAQNLLQTLETNSDLKTQSRALFDLTKRMQSGTLSALEQREIFQRLYNFINRQEVSEITQRMIAVLGGLLSEDTQLEIIKKLANSTDKTVQATAISALSYRLSDLPKNWPWFSEKLKVASDEVVLEGLKVMERFLAKESSFPKEWAPTLRILSERKNSRLQWHSLLLLGLHEFPSVQSRLQKILSESFQWKEWKETVLEEYQLKTLTLMDRNWNKTLERELIQLAKSISHVKMKSVIEDLIKRPRNML